MEALVICFQSGPEFAMPTIGFLETLILLIMLVILTAVIYVLFLLIRLLVRLNRRMDVSKKSSQGQGPLNK